MKKVDAWYSTLTQGDRDYAEAHCYDGLLKGAYLAGRTSMREECAEVVDTHLGKLYKDNDWKPVDIAAAIRRIKE